MISMIIWVLALAGSIAAVCMAVAFDAHASHIGATALVTLGIVAAAVNEHRSAELAGMSPFGLSAIAARFMGLLWAWSAISAYVVYSFILDWPHWMPVVVAMFVGCCVCLFVALVLDREDAAEVPDAWAPALVGMMSRSQFTLGAVLFGVLFAVQQHGDFNTDGAPKWVAVNLALCTAAGLLSLTGYLIMQERNSITATGQSEQGKAAA